MCTAQSSRPGVENSRVPSNGSMIHTRSDFQPDQIVMSFLAEHRIAGPLGPQPAQQQLVGVEVTGVAERPRVPEADLVAHLQQQLARVRGEIGSQGGVGQVLRRRAHRFSIADSRP